MMAKRQQPEMLTTADIAKRLRMNVDVVRRKLRRGEIPASKIGKLWRTDESTLDKWLRAQGGRQMKGL